MSVKFYILKHVDDDITLTESVKQLEIPSDIIQYLPSKLILTTNESSKAEKTKATNYFILEIIKIIDNDDKIIRNTTKAIIIYKQHKNILTQLEYLLYSKNEIISKDALYLTESCIKYYKDYIELNYKIDLTLTFFEVKLTSKIKFELNFELNFKKLKEIFKKIRLILTELYKIIGEMLELIGFADNKIEYSREITNGLAFLYIRQEKKAKELEDIAIKRADIYANELIEEEALEVEKLAAVKAKKTKKAANKSAAKKEKAAALEAKDVAEKLIELDRIKEMKRIKKKLLDKIEKEIKDLENIVKYIKIQSYMRRHIAIKKYNEKKTTKINLIVDSISIIFTKKIIDIQKHIRRYLLQKKYNNYINNIIIIQKQVRRYYLQKWYNNHHYQLQLQLQIDKHLQKQYCEDYNLFYSNRYYQNYLFENNYNKWFEYSSIPIK